MFWNLGDCENRTVQPCCGDGGALRSILCFGEGNVSFDESGMKLPEVYEGRTITRLGEGTEVFDANHESR